MKSGEQVGHEQKGLNEASNRIHGARRLDAYKSLGDYEESKVNFGLMNDNCNRCHDVFENGKHQLKKNVRGAQLKPPAWV
jgi:hypothetical protein